MADHSDAQQRLVQAALKVFASKGYEGASTREICRLAEVNVAAIHYYFGDKASLYREVFRLPEVLGQLPTEMDDPEMPLRAVLVAFYRHILSYIVAPEQVQQMRLLFLREELHPSGVLDEHRRCGAAGARTTRQIPRARGRRARTRHSAASTRIQRRRVSRSCCSCTATRSTGRAAVARR